MWIENRQGWAKKVKVLSKKAKPTKKPHRHRQQYDDSQRERGMLGVRGGERGEIEVKGKGRINADGRRLS